MKTILKILMRSVALLLLVIEQVPGDTKIKL